VFLVGLTGTRELVIIVMRNEMCFIHVHLLMKMDPIWFGWVGCTYLPTYFPDRGCKSMWFFARS
jgi:hypothetical protein